MQLRRRDGERGQPDAGQAMTDAVERRPPRTHHEHALARAHELAHRVDDGLRAAGARKRLHRERLSGEDPGEHGLLLAVGVEEEAIGCRGPVVRADESRDAAESREILAVADVTAEGVQDGVVEVLGIPRHVRGDVGERRDHEARQHRERVDVGGQGTQMVDDGLRLEHAVVVRERGERAPVDRDAEVSAGDLDELGVDRERPVQTQVEVEVVPADRQRAQQHGRRVRDAADAPGGDRDGEMDGVEAAGCAQLDVFRGDALGSALGREQSYFVAEEIGQERRAAGDELREAARVGLRDVDAGVTGIRVVQQRRRAAELSALLAEAVALRLSGVRHPDPRLRQIEVGRGHCAHVLGVVHASHGATVCSPHTRHHRRARVRKPVRTAGFVGLDPSSSPQRPFSPIRPQIRASPAPPTAPTP